MENWKNYISKYDIRNAARAAGVDRENYNLSRKLQPEEWTSAMVAINYELKRIVIEREMRRAEFIKEANATC